MNTSIYSNNPTVKAVVTGTAPRPARLAAARGVLPLPQTDLLEILASLALGEQDAEIAETARQTLNSQDAGNLQPLLESREIAPPVLEYYAARENLPSPVYEAIIANPHTPPNAYVKFAGATRDGNLLELISFNQQLLINNPAILEAISANPHRTAEAERRTSEIRREFFEKERGAKQIADELRARGRDAAAEFIEQAEFAENFEDSGLTYDDAMLLAEHIEVPDAETDDTWLASLEYLEEIYEETDEQREAIVRKILGELSTDEEEINGERISMINRILRMGMKDRVKLAMKGDREARNILIRDPNRIVSQAVVNNPRITEQEIEKIAAMRAVPEDVLRLIAINRNWTRKYSVIHTLARNPRTPLSNTMSILTRLQMRDLIALSKNRNVSDNVRRQALRLSVMRKGG